MCGLHLDDESVIYTADMRYSQYFIPTLKEDPADAEVVSQKLMIRAGMIRKVAAGIYNYLPLGLRCISKVENIVREEMNRAGAIELLMPAVVPAELWRESGRWDYYGKELLRFKDRAEREFCIGPTHEEVVTDIVRRDVRSYKQLPINLYQIQTKFRDEIRPRFGVMRAREFIMKDAYSFDADAAGAEKSYQLMYDAYVPHIREVRPRVQGRARRYGEHRRELLPRVHGARAHGRGRGDELRQVRIRGKPRARRDRLARERG